MSSSDEQSPNSSSVPESSPAERVKDYSRSIGADLVGIADAEVLDNNPPDPNHPQVPSRIWNETNSVVVAGIRVPLGEFLSDNHHCIGYLNQLIVHKIDRISHRISHFIEDELGERALQVANDETDPDLKQGSYGFLSLRHAAAEAGLGTFGLEANLLTPEYGPRVYFAAVLTTANLEPDERITHQVCIGEGCGRCLKACPSDAIEHFTLDKVKCASAAQYQGARSIIYGPLRAMATLEDSSDILSMLDTNEVRKKYMSIVRKINAFGACPRCVEVCPIGIDYGKFLAQEQKNIPENNKEKEEKLKEMLTASQAGEFAEGNKPVNKRWIGEDGYKPFMQILKESDRGNHIALTNSSGDKK
jgi:epoxyqueuosine reductase QueG